LDLGCHFTAFCGTLLAGFGTSLAMFSFMFTAFFGAVIAHLSTELTDFLHKGRGSLFRAGA
jgi:hypothetical protein